MDKNLGKQLEHDFGKNIEDLIDGKNHFVYNHSKIDFLSYNDHRLAINCLANTLLVRSADPDLLAELEAQYSNYPAAWFMEMENISKLQQILGKYHMEIKNMAPVMVPRPDFKEIPSPYKFSRIDPKDYQSFKDMTKFALSFDPGYYKDKLVLASYDDDRLIALAGAGQNSKYLWEIGVEKFDFSPKYQDLGHILVNQLTAIARKENPEITPIYASQFSHSKSINLAIRAGYQLGLTLIVGD